MTRLHRLYLAPGMFGFGKLASYDYFAHVERALKARFRAAGEELRTYVVDVPPTASIRRRAVRLAELVASTADDDDGANGTGGTAGGSGTAGPIHRPIHLLGHSTGGLDARLVASPSAHLPLGQGKLDWRARLASVTTMNTPHYGTPLAGFFATVSGQRMLYALSALTFIGLSVGAPPLAAASALVMAVGNLDRALGVELRVLDGVTDALLRALEPATSREVRAYLDAIRRDQGAVVQLTPEAMDLFVAGVEDRAGVFYQCACSMAPSPSAFGLARSFVNPWRALSSALFTTMHGLTARYDESYPCAAADVGADVEARLAQVFGRAPGVRSNDGVVPLRSQIWGKIAWMGYADHLDVLGHFSPPKAATSLWSSLFGSRSEAERAVAVAETVGTGRPVGGDRIGEATREAERDARALADEGGLVVERGADAVHVDWLASGSNFDEGGFGELMDAVAAGMLASTASRG